MLEDGLKKKTGKGNGQNIDVTWTKYSIFIIIIIIQIQKAIFFKLLIDVLHSKLNLKVKVKNNPENQNTTEALYRMCDAL